MKIFNYRMPACIGLLLVAFLSVPVQGGGDAPEYDANSWQSVIADDCRAFFDGCNNCRREPGKIAACTRMACAVYQQPRCLDTQTPEAGTSGSPVAKQVSYRCAAGARFSVAYHEFRQDDQVVRLDRDQVMLRGAQTQTLHLLKRETAASGERYADDSGLRLSSKGNQALLMQGDQRIYRDCVIES